MTSPLVGVTSRYGLGADRLDTPDLIPVQSVTLEEALRTDWPFDAHFGTYYLVKDGQPVLGWPRCNKPVLSSVRAAGFDLRIRSLAFDYDNPGHGPWQPGMREAFEVSIATAADYGLGLAMSWTALYFTQGGARLVYALSSSVSPEEAEGLMAGVQRDFLAYGVRIDPLCDWNRVFRLPRVLRDGRATAQEPYFDMLEQPGMLLDPATIIPGKVSIAQSYAPIERLSLPLPDPDSVRGRLFELSPSTGREVQTYFYKQAKKWLRGRDCYSVVFERRPLAAPGSRHNAIQRLIGEAVGILFAANIAATAEDIYALFFEPLEQLNAADLSDPENFLVTGWTAILDYWAKEDAKARAHQEQLHTQQHEFQQHQQTVSQRVLAGLRSWAKNFMPQEDNQALWWAAERLIAATHSHFHIMTTSGHYDHVGVPKHLIVARVRELRMDALMPLEKLEDGKTRPVTSQDLIDRHATAISEVEGAIGISGTHIKGFGTDHPTLVLRLFSRKKLEPTFDAEVDLWLRMLAGDNYDALQDWIGHALDFEGGPICALSLAGSPGCGKKLFYQGLAECIDTETVASSKQFGRFQGLLTKTPFLVVNEGLEKVSGGMHAADTFRHFVSGDPLYVEEKFKEIIKIRNPLRVIFAANNLDVIQTIVGARDLSPDDRDALASRIMHIQVDAQAAPWLRAKGGLSYTKGWISSDDGGPSSYKVARHFLHLYATRPPVPAGNRFLVEGNVTSDLIRQMSTRSGTAPLVIETLIRMVETDIYLEGFVIDRHHIYVTTSAIVDFWRSSSLNTAGANLNHKAVGKVLKGLTLPDSSTDPRKIETSRGEKKAKWREIDPVILLEEAIEHGYSCRRLESIANDRLIVAHQIEQMTSIVQEHQQHVWP